MSTQQAQLGKVTPLTTYTEPEVYAAVLTTATENGISASAWVRRLVMTELVRLGKISPETLVRLASA